MSLLTITELAEIRSALAEANELRMTSFWAQGCLKLLAERDELRDALKRLVYATASRNVHGRYLDFERALADARKLVDGVR